jgi:hypothetical protein
MRLAQLALPEGFAQFSKGVLYEDARRRVPDCRVVLKRGALER